MTNPVEFVAYCCMVVGGMFLLFSPLYGDVLRTWVVSRERTRTYDLYTRQVEALAKLPEQDRRQLLDRMPSWPDLDDDTN